MASNLNVCTVHKKCRCFANLFNQCQLNIYHFKNWNSLDKYYMAKKLFQSEAIWTEYQSAVKIWNWFERKAIEFLISFILSFNFENTANIFSRSHCSWMRVEISRMTALSDFRHLARNMSPTKWNEKLSCLPKNWSDTSKIANLQN